MFQICRAQILCEVFQISLITQVALEIHEDILAGLEFNAQTLAVADVLLYQFNSVHSKPSQFISETLCKDLKSTLAYILDELIF